MNLTQKERDKLLRKFGQAPNMENRERERAKTRAEIDKRREFVKNEMSKGVSKIPLTTG